MATKRQIKKVVKKVLAAPPKSKTILVGKPSQSVPTINVLGIEFEQGSEYEFGKCIRPSQPNRVWTYIHTDGHYILWGRHPQDRQMDTSRLSDQQWTQQMYQVVDWDTPLVTAGPANMIADMLDEAPMMGW